MDPGYGAGDQVKKTRTKVRRRVGIYPNLSKDECRDVMESLVRFLEERGHESWVSDRLPSPHPAGVHAAPPNELPRHVDFLVVLGGDGTLLSAARLVYPLKVPLMGVNFGDLGFLTDLSVETMFDGLEAVLLGKYHLERRMMLKTMLLSKRGQPRATLYALNDAVVREANFRALQLTTTLAGVTLSSFKADGLIVSTPTGSTAYSLSAGGPIIEPTLQSLIATPICPHRLSVRPLIFPANQTIEVSFGPEDARVHLAVDGQLVIELSPQDRLLARRAERPIYFLQLRPRSFYEVLRAKLKWGG
jgi:NAD+ kinase